jgi:hypothetical protein
MLRFAASAQRPAVHVKLREFNEKLPSKPGLALL